MDLSRSGKPHKILAMLAWIFLKKQESLNNHVLTDEIRSI